SPETSVIVLFRTTLLVHANPIPLAAPDGPISLFSTIALVHRGSPPSGAWMLVQLLDSTAFTLRITCPDAEPPARMSALASAGPRLGRLPSTMTWLSTTFDRSIMETAVAPNAP